jgi:two-component system cell cycle sensor histidine kinase/response regulator CckA
MANVGELDRLATENAELRRRLDELERKAAASATGSELRAAIHATGLGLWSWEVDEREPVWDDSVRKMHGRLEAPSVERYFHDIVHPLDRSEVTSCCRRLLERKGWDSVQYRILRADGAVRWVLVSASVVTSPEGDAIRLVGSMLDVTEQRTLEEQLRQAQKMEAIGNLTAGIAHNFNNMLAVIMPTLEVAQGLLPNERKPILREASHAARRASELVRQLMMFAGHGVSNQRAHHSSHEIVEAAVGICARAFEPHLVLSTTYDCSPATLLCDAGQIEQVIVNLLVNARDAVLAAGPPRCHVSVRVSLRRELDSEGSVYIQVSDDGIGMTEEVKSKAFDPFFTTKAVGRGTGLGLATSYAIIRDHHGRLECISHAGLGTTFTMVLPLSKPAAATRSRTPTPIWPASALTDPK